MKIYLPLLLDKVEYGMRSPSQFLEAKKIKLKGTKHYSLNRRYYQNRYYSAVWIGESTLSQAAKKCFPTCELFRCGQRALYLRMSKAFCRWADDECAGATCSYVSCARGRLLANGICGMSIKRQTVEERGPEEVEIPKVKLKGKVLQKLGDQEVI